MLRLCVALLLLASPMFCQSMGSAGTVRGKVSDPSGAVIAGATVELSNDLTLYRQQVKTSASGEFQFANIPPNVYHLSISAPGFAHHHRDLTIRSAVPVNLEISLPLAAQSEAVTVSSEAALLEATPSAHTDVDRELFSKMPTSSIASGLSDIITLSTPAVVADSDGFFHSLGDHAQMALSIDNQPITDQQGSLFSTQIPLNAIQAVEAVYGGTPAEYGDKTSLVVTTITRSGLGQKTHGSFSGEYGSFGTVNQKADISFGSQRWGQFFAINTSRSGRFLDTPEYLPVHDIGNNMNVFSRSDYQPDTSDMFHLNILAARNWFQIPNTIDQQASGQDQRQMVRSFSIAPGWIHVFSPSTTLAVNPFVRQDLVNYYPSGNPFADQPGTLRQTRKLTNLGLKTDLSYVHGRHNAKFGAQITHTLLTEQFSLGLTDPTFNPVCLDAGGAAVTDPALTDPAMCAGSGFQANPNLSPGLVPYDLTRGGSLFQYRGHADIRQQAFYGQDAISLGKLTLSLGLRFDHYDGISHGTQPQPRVGASYLIAPTRTVVRIAYSHSYETPLNENLVLSSATGAGGLAANVFGAYASVPLQPGIRNMYNAGLEQNFGSHFVFEGDYFWKFTRNAFDLDNLFTTAIFFPIEWDHAKMDGFSARLSLRQYKGLSAYTTLGHTRARVFDPENGGLIFGSPVDRSVVRIDHDQAFQSTTQAQYQMGKHGPWVAFTWRFDSGIVSGAVPDLASALALTADQQAQIGFYCGSQVATPWSPITTCNVPWPNWGAKLVKIPAPGTENDDTNPARVRPRNLFDTSVGTDNLFHTEHVRWTLRLTALNITNKLAMYNFLSTCSGTHFVAPRAYRAELGIAF
ncbi:MAG: TonB-dependent receptor [Bryobacteraceae bacterium]|jgi:hypothetical protein